MARIRHAVDGIQRHKRNTASISVAEKDLKCKVGIYIAVAWAGIGMMNVVSRGIFTLHLYLRPIPSQEGEEAF